MSERCTSRRHRRPRATHAGPLWRAAHRARCCRRRCRGRSSFRRKAGAPRWRVRCRRNSRRPWCPASLGQFPTCRTVPRHSRTAPRAAPSSRALTACREARATGTWARACSERAVVVRHLPALSRRSCRGAARVALSPHDKIAARVKPAHYVRQQGVEQEAAVHRRLALILSSAAEPGQSSRSPSVLSGASTVLRWPCRSSDSGAT
jgi:hypothetical protein